MARYYWLQSQLVRSTIASSAFQVAFQLQIWVERSGSTKLPCVYTGARREEEEEIMGAFVCIRPGLGLVPTKSSSFTYDALDEFKILKSQIWSNYKNIKIIWNHKKYFAVERNRNSMWKVLKLIHIKEKELFKNEVAFFPSV